MKKLLSLLLALLLIVGAIPMAAIPTAYAWISGPDDMCGENITFTYNETTGELVISGTGPMKDFNYYGPFGDGVKNIVIEDSITYIGNYMFYYLKDLTSVTIPESVTAIGDYAFYGCENLENIIIPDSVTHIGKSAFQNCDALINLDLPDSLISISSSAFSGCYNLTNVNFPDGLISIDDYAFSGYNNLTSIVIPDSVKSIGRGAFYSSQKLKNIHLGNGLETIGDNVFRDCVALEEITIPDSVISIGENAFGSCLNLKNVTLGNSVETIGDMAFYFCGNLESINIPASVTSIGIGALYCCLELKDLTADENNAVYSSDEDGVLYNKDKTVLLLYPAGSKNTSYTIPESVATIDSYAFCFCKALKRLTIPGNVKTVNQEAFTGCFNLSEVVISNGVDSIREHAFEAVLSLESVIVEDMDVDIASKSLGVSNIKLLDLEREEFIDYYERYVKSGGNEAVLDEFEDRVEFCDGTFTVGTVYCHAGSTAEAYAIENGQDYVLTHFYEDEWQDGDDNVCRFRKCIHCDEMEVIEHNMGDFVVTKEATCTEKGEERATCAECDYYEIREIPIKEHTDEDLDGYCDSCNEYIADEDCLCICHAKTIGAFVYRLFKAIDKVFKTRLVEKVFGITDICVCGIKHK